MLVAIALLGSSIVHIFSAANGFTKVKDCKLWGSLDRNGEAIATRDALGFIPPNLFALAGSCQDGVDATSGPLAGRR